MQIVNRIANNVGVTYLKAFFTVLISLYSTRLVLSALGAEDYGLFNVIGGLTLSLSFLNSVMATSTQRHISISIGGGDDYSINKIFTNSIIIHIVLAILLTIFLLILGQYLITESLTIPNNRTKTAVYLLYFTIISTFFTVVSVPYDSIIIAYEKFKFLAIVGILEVVLKLIAALSLLYFDGDKLLLYGIFIMIINILNRYVKSQYCRRIFVKIKYGGYKEFDKYEIRKITTFAGWQLFGNLSAIARNQGLSVVLNLFFQTTVNAAYGIANQINSQLMFFSESLLNTIRPQIMKNEGANNREKMLKISASTNKFSFFLFIIIALPAYILLPNILSFWLVDVPEFTVEFCRSIIILTMFNQLNQGTITALMAIGNIKYYQIIVGGTLLLTLPIGYIFLKLGHPPQSVIYIAIILEVASTFTRIIILNYQTGYSIKSYFKNVILRLFIYLSPVSVLMWFICSALSSNFISVVLICISSFILNIVFFYLLGLTKSEKTVVVNVVNYLVNKLIGLKQKFI